MQYKCQYPNCERNADGQLKGENLCQPHYQKRLEQSCDRTRALIEQERIDQKRIEKAGEWRNGFRSVLP